MAPKRTEEEDVAGPPCLRKYTHQQQDDPFSGMPFCNQSNEEVAGALEKSRFNLRWTFCEFLPRGLIRDLGVATVAATSPIKSQRQQQQKETVFVEDVPEEGDPRIVQLLEDDGFAEAFNM